MLVGFMYCDSLAYVGYRAGTEAWTVGMLAWYPMLVVLFGIRQAFFCTSGAVLTAGYSFPTQIPDRMNEALPAVPGDTPVTAMSVLASLKGANAGCCCCTPSILASMTATCSG